MAKVRLNITLEEDTKSWCDGEADKMGMSTNAFINLAIAQYKQQSEGLKAMQNFSDLRELLEKLNQTIELQKENN